MSDANPQVAEGYTQVPNALLDQMAAMGEAELRVVLAVVRQTIGFHQPAAPISTRDFEALTGLSHRGVRNGVTAAAASGWIEKTGERGFRGTECYRPCYLVARNDEPTVLLSSTQVDDHATTYHATVLLSSTQTPATVLLSSTPQRQRNKNKETTKKKEGADAPTPPVAKKRGRSKLDRARDNAYVQAFVNAFPDGYRPPVVANMLDAAGPLKKAGYTPEQLAGLVKSKLAGDKPHYGYKMRYALEDMAGYLLRTRGRSASNGHGPQPSPNDGQRYVTGEFAGYINH